MFVVYDDNIRQFSLEVNFNKLYMLYVSTVVRVCAYEYIF